MSESAPIPPSSSGNARKSMLTHSRGPAAVEKEANPSSTLHAALARANRTPSKGLMSGGEDTLPHDDPHPMSPEASKSSLHQAIARANDSRTPGSSRHSHEPPPAPPPTLSGLLFNFEDFSDAMHPLRGWLIAFPLFVISGFLWVHLPIGPPLPPHPAPGFLLGGESRIWTVLLLRDVLTGLLLVLGSLIVTQGVYMLAGKGRPPLAWTLKALTYALLPLTFVRLFYLLQRLEPGVEVYFRGYVAESLRFWFLVLMVFASAWSAFRLSQAANSRHCQARFVPVLRVFLLLPVLVIGLVWTNPLEKLRMTEELAFDEKSALYLQRGEAAWLENDTLAAREDFLRLYRMYPEGHPLREFGLAATRLIQGQLEEGASDLLALAERVDAAPTYYRWLSYVYLGRFGGEAAPSHAERWAQRAWLTEPSPGHGALVVEALSLQEKDRALLRFVTDYEVDLTFPPLALLRAAASALRTGREIEGRRWARDAWDAKPDLLQHPLSAALIEAGITSHP